MLQLKNVVKEYNAGNTVIKALKGVTLEFRKNEFVSILGPSGCGKTTMLNIIGGLDRYTNGDLVINGVSTTRYKAVDWDIYRNNSIGFVFQTYNLIPHQSVLANVELAMTLAGVSHSERRRRAAEALEKVGLGDQIRKKPNQLSGGQMQRVAIARALVNNPDILLADEPTGALDSETSVQIMEILKEIAKDRLVIMVTHNPDLANNYSTRIIKLLDGQIIEDSNPYDSKEDDTRAPGKRKKISMSFFTALSLSLNNLMTKKTRTVLTAFAGSIGIIGIALILSLSNGMQTYIDNMQKDTLSTYPITINNQSMDMMGMMSAMMGAGGGSGTGHANDKVYSNNIMTELMKTASSKMTNNDLSRFMSYLESEEGQKIKELTNSVQYGYNLELQIFNANTASGILQVHPSDLFNQMNMNSMQSANGSSTMGNNNGMMMMMNSDVFGEAIENQELLESQYDLVEGVWPSAYNELLLVIDENNELSDAELYTIGVMDPSVLSGMMEKIWIGEPIDESEIQQMSFTYEELLEVRFKLVLNSDYYIKENGVWIEKKNDPMFMKQLIDNAEELRISGIVRPKPDVASTSISSAIAYSGSLTRHVAERINASDIVKELEANPEINLFTGLPFKEKGALLTMDEIRTYVETLPEDEQVQTNAMISAMDESDVIAMFSSMMSLSQSGITSYEDALEQLGVIDFANPSAISIYPKDFEAKESIKSYIADYNKAQRDAGNEEYVISYSDIMAVMMSSVTSVINIITYALVAFVSISLVVSSIMIGIITYISVLERTKEIGILRSIGASKKDISRVFNAETIIIGFVSGSLGIIITLLLNIPINAIIKGLAGVSGISSLPLVGAVALIIISMVLTFVAGLIPSRVAAKKDPVVALRTE